MIALAVTTDADTAFEGCELEDCDLENCISF